jgi:hypothetical protein
MQTDSQIACDSSPSPRSTHSQNSADILYQGLTIAAALVLLGSLWVF